MKKFGKKESLPKSITNEADRKCFFIPVDIQYLILEKITEYKDDINGFGKYIIALEGILGLEQSIIAPEFNKIYPFRTLVFENEEQAIIFYKFINRNGYEMGVSFFENKECNVYWIHNEDKSMVINTEWNYILSKDAPQTEKLKDLKSQLSNLFDIRLFAAQNPDQKIVLNTSLDIPEVIPKDVVNISSIKGYINISGNRYEDGFSFSLLKELGGYFYFTDKNNGDNKTKLKKMLPLISEKDRLEKCIPLNNIEYTFYEGMDIMNSASGYRVDNHGNPEALQLFSPLFVGIRPDILWFQDLVQGIKKISPSYLVMLDKNNIPNNSLYIDHRKHMVYLNKIEAVIKIPKGAIQSNNNENYILINKPQAIGGVPKDILFMDLTKNFPKDMKKVLATIQDFLVGKLHVSDTHFRAISKHKLKEPYILEPSLYI